MSTTEVLTENGWKNLLPPLPVIIYEHCSVLIDSSTVFIIGGRQTGSVQRVDGVQNSVDSAKTYFFTTGNNGWTEGPTLIAAR